MKNPLQHIAKYMIVLLMGVIIAGAGSVFAARENDVWVERLGTYVESVWNEGRDVLINGTNKYLNFGSISGSSGYGIRDNAGTIETKNSGGSWSAVGAVSLSSDSITPNFVHTTGQTDEYCLTYEATGSTWEWQACSSGSGDNISIDGGAVTDPDFVSTGDIDFVDTSDTITANINAGSIVNTDVNASAAIAYSKLNLTGTLLVGDLSSADFGDFTCNGTVCTIDTSYQPLDTGLTSIAGLTTAADTMIYTSALDTYATTPLTSFGRSLIDDAAASNARTTLGLGSLATLSTISNSQWSGTDLSVANGGTGASTFTAGGILYGNGTTAFSNSGVLTNGQLLIGDGTTFPTVAGLTQGTGITVTNGAGSITIASTLGTTIAAAEIDNDTVTNAQIDDADQTSTLCIYIEDPVDTDDLQSIWANKTANDFLLTKIWAESDQTVNLDLQVDDGTPADVNGTDISPAAGEAEDTSLSGDTTLASGEELDLAITSVSGTPTWVSICWTGNWVD